MKKISLFDPDGNELSLSEDILCIRPKDTHFVPCPNCKLLFIHITDDWNDRFPNQQENPIEEFKYLTTCSRCDCIIYAGSPRFGWTKLKELSIKC